MELDLMFLKKTPPHSPEAEKTILGGILVNNKNLNVVLSIISIEDFYKEGNRRILEKIAQLVDRGLPVDLLSLSEELKKTGDLDEIGGASYLASLMDGVPKSLNVEYYAQIIKADKIHAIGELTGLCDISDSRPMRSGCCDEFIWERRAFSVYRLFGKERETETLEAAEEFVEVNIMDTADNKKLGHIGIRVEKIDEFADTERVLRAVRKGDIVFLKIKSLREKDMGELKRAVENLKKTVSANSGDNAGVEQDWLIISPEFGVVERD